MPPRRRSERLEAAVALLGLAPHRAQGRRRELALDVLHEVCAAFALPCCSRAPRRDARALFLQQLLSKNFVRLCAATTVVLFAADYTFATRLLVDPCSSKAVIQLALAVWQCDPHNLELS